MIAEIDYPDALLSLCLDNPGQRYPIPEARLGHMHSLQTTESFIIVAENAYLHDPCSEVNYDPSLANYPMSFSFEADSKSRIHIINKNGNVEARLEVNPFFITLVLGSYEDPESNKVHFDVLQYDDAGIYEDVSVRGPGVTAVYVSAEAGAAVSGDFLYTAGDKLRITLPK